MKFVLLVFARRQLLLSIVLVSMGALALSGIARAQPDIKDVFQSALACAVVDPLLADMTVAPLYLMIGNECVSQVPDDNESSRYFSDSACTEPLAFQPTSLSSHCSLLLDSSRLGEGDGINEEVWTLSPGTRLDLGARSLEAVTQPYMQRHVYKSIVTAGGTCNLEMRVYSPEPGGDGYGSLLALHGGSWSSRGFGFFGLELTLPHYIDQGFVVYAPFYRLLGTSDGSAACNNATIEQVVEDAQDALQWVRDRAELFGSDAKPVVFGQSAGAHLALSLAVNQPDAIAGGILFYPPTDFTDFTLRAQAGLYDNPEGLGILDKVINVVAADADINASPIPENSFPIRIAESGLFTPPLMIVHGVADELVEVRQSVRLCDALAGRELLALNEAPESFDNLRQVVLCGAGSQLQLIKEGRHALDVCLADVLIPTDLCPSGSRGSREEVSQAIASAVTFARDVSVGDSPQVEDTSTTKRGAVSLVLLLILLTGVTLSGLRNRFRHGFCCTVKTIRD